MCSNASDDRAGAATPGELASRLAAVIDACAEAASDHEGPDCDAEAHVADRLAAAWAMLAGADPNLAARLAHYCDPPGHETRLAPDSAR